jgi:hypothetical protein
MRDRRAWSCFAVLILVTVFGATPARAAKAPGHEDVQVVEKAEIIVVGRLARDSIAIDRTDPTAGKRHDRYMGTLVIAEVLKGNLEEKKVPLVLEYGLMLGVDGQELRDAKPAATAVIDVLAMEEDIGRAVVVKNVCENNLWMLRKDEGVIPAKGGADIYALSWVEGLQPLALKSYFAAYLDKDPEAAVRREKDRNPAVADRAQRYLDHMEVGRILKNPDAEARAKALLPFFQKQFHWGDEVREGLIACGDPAGQLLVQLFKDPRNNPLFFDIFYVWEKMKYAGCGPALTDLLREDIDYWVRRQKADPQLAKEKNTPQYYQASYAIRVLGVVRYADAQAAIERLKALWQDLDKTRGKPGSIVDACDKALEALAPR